MRALGLAALLTVCSAGCSAAPQPAPSTAPQPDKSGFTTIACAESIDTVPRPPDDRRVVGGEVALPAADVVEPADSGRPAPLRLFAKWALLVRGGATVRITVAPGWTDRGWVGWGQPGEPSTAVQLTGCPATDGAEAWSVFAGGSWVTDPACVPLLVEAGGETARLDVAIGKPCRK
ncbi:MAG: hypothetical protein ABW046_11285 [Actinoplanes sp.]